jgi:hypothetical protein
MLICAVFAAVLTTSASASTASAPRLVARVTAVAHKPYPRAGALIALSFTVGEPGQPPGSGVPQGSVFEVQLTRKTGLPTNLTTATGTKGQYHATIRWSGGQVRAIRVGGFLNATPSTAQSGFWLPVTVVKKNF